jgi:pimeloyl-ACP methyl ester carboxylesterase
LDIRGYGGSDKPAAMDEDASASEPLAPASEAVQDIDDAVNHLRTASGYSRIDLVGGSWGSITCGMYAAGPGREKVHRLVLYAPIYRTANQEWLDMLADPQDPARFNPALGGYRWVTEEDVLFRWDKEIPVPDKEDWRPRECFKALINEAFRWDPAGAARQPRAFRAPNGTLVDLFEAFSGRPLYDPQAIEAPTLLIRGADDPTATDEDAKALFQRLGSKEKRYIAIGHGSHFMVAEKNRWQLFAESFNFLETCKTP